MRIFFFMCRPERDYNNLVTTQRTLFLVQKNKKHKPKNIYWK